MLVVFPAWEMPAEPWTTVPPVGPANAGRCSAINAATAVAVAKDPCAMRWSPEGRGTAAAGKESDRALRFGAAHSAGRPCLRV